MTRMRMRAMMRVNAAVDINTSIMDINTNTTTDMDTLMEAMGINTVTPAFKHMEMMETFGNINQDGSIVMRANGFQKRTLLAN